MEGSAIVLSLLLSLSFANAGDITTIKTQFFCTPHTEAHYSDFSRDVVESGSKVKMCGCTCTGGKCFECPHPSVTGRSLICLKCPSFATQTADGRCKVEKNGVDMSYELELPQGYVCDRPVDNKLSCKKICDEDLPCPVSEGSVPCGQLDIPEETTSLGVVESAVTRSAVYVRKITLTCPAKESFKIERLHEVEGHYYCKYSSPPKEAFVDPVPDAKRCTNEGFTLDKATDTCITERPCPPVEERGGDLLCGPVTETYINKLKNALQRIQETLNKRYVRTCAFNCGNAVYRWQECRALGGLSTHKNIRTAMENLAIELRAAKNKKERMVLEGRITSCVSTFENKEQLLAVPTKDQKPEDVPFRPIVYDVLSDALISLSGLDFSSYVRVNIPMAYSSKIDSALQSTLMKSKEGLLTMLTNKMFAKNFASTSSRHSDGPGMSCRDWAKMSLLKTFTRSDDSFEFFTERNEDLKFDSLFNSCVALCEEELGARKETRK